MAAAAEAEPIGSLQVPVPQHLLHEVAALSGAVASELADLADADRRTQPQPAWRLAYHLHQGVAARVHRQEAAGHRRLQVE